MKVLDLHCDNQHVFEGWFASEEDFLDQKERSMVQCPVCGNSQVTKKLSAPRLNLSSVREVEAVPHSLPAHPETPPDKGSRQVPGQLMEAWLQIARKIVENTTDVGDQFAQEARKMHYGETDARSIRGQTTLEEAKDLMEEGIDVIPLPLPAYLKETLQ